MGFERSFDEKIDVIDLIINVLKDHEVKLDELVSRLEGVYSAPPDEAQTEDAPETTVVPPRPSGPPGPIVTAVLKKWTEFRERSASATLASFDVVGGVFEASALAQNVIHVYREEIPRMTIVYREGEGAEIEGIDISKPSLIPAALKERLDCGLEFSRRDLETKMGDGRVHHEIVFEIDPGTAKSWIAYQLGVDDSDVIQGSIQA